MPRSAHIASAWLDTFEKIIVLFEDTRYRKSQLRGEDAKVVVDAMIAMEEASTQSFGGKHHLQWGCEEGMKRMQDPQSLMDGIKRIVIKKGTYGLDSLLPWLIPYDQRDMHIMLLHLLTSYQRHLKETS